MNLRSHKRRACAGMTRRIKRLYRIFRPFPLRIVGIRLQWTGPRHGGWRVWCCDDIPFSIDAS